MRNIFAAIVCGLVSSAVAIAPHWAQWRTDGQIEYLASGDDVIYLAVARAAYAGEGRLRDPYSILSEKTPTAFSWYQFVPFTRPLAIAGVSFFQIPLVWRVMGGFCLGITGYILCFYLTDAQPFRSVLAVGLTLILLNDPGTISGRPIVQTLLTMRDYAAGIYRNEFADGIGQYRIVNPLLNYPWMFLVVAAAFSGMRTWRWIASAGVCVGVCTLLYFFFWTGIVGTLGLYGVIQFIRWRFGSADGFTELRFAALTAIIGLLIGSSQILSNSATFADPAFRGALDRTSLGYHVPSGDPVRTQYLVGVTFFVTSAVTIASLSWKWSNKLAFAGCLTLAGYLLRNSAVVTRLEFENYHWSYLQGLGISLTWMILGLRVLPSSSWVSFCVLAVGTVVAAFAFVWRAEEPKHCRETISLNETLRELTLLADDLQRLSPDTSLAGPDETRVAILFGRCGQLYNVPHTSHRSLIPDDEVHLRHAANAWLQGVSEEQYRIDARDPHFSMTPSSRPEWQADAVAESRMMLFQEIEKNPTKIERFQANAILTRRTAPRPRGDGWIETARTNEWILWTKSPSK